MLSGAKAILTAILVIVAFMIIFGFSFRLVKINNDMQDNSKKATEIYLGDGGTA